MDKLGYFMRTKHLCVLIHIRIKGDVGTVKHVKPSRIFLLTFLLENFFLFVICVLCLSLPYYIICFLHPCGHLLGKG